MKGILFFILSLTLSAIDIYTYKDVNEAKILERYRSEPIVLMLDNSEYKNEEFEGESINSIVEDLFKNYLRLNIVVKNKDLENINNFSGDMILGGILQSEDEYKNILFSFPLYNEDLYIVFDNKESDKRNLKLYKSFFDFNLFCRNVDHQLTSEYKQKIKQNNYSLYSTQESIWNFDKVKISYLPSRVIGLSEKYKDLLPIINNAISEKYYKKINNFLDKRKFLIENKMLLDMLTDDEKRYLEQNKEIFVAFESQQTYSYYLKENDEYVGSLATLLQNLSKILGVEFKIKNGPEDSWDSLLNLFESNEVQMIPIIKTKKRQEKYIFSTVLDNIYLYKVKIQKKLLKNNTNIIGVLKNSFEEEFARLYFNKNIIKTYNNYKELNNALLSQKVDFIYTTNIEDIDSSNIILEKGKYPLVFAYNKNNYLLKSILDKAILISDDLNNILKKGVLEKEVSKLKEKKKEDNIKITLILIIIVSGMLIIKLTLKNKSSKKLLIDKLTGLPNNYKYIEDSIKYDSMRDYTFIKLKLNVLLEINRKLGWDIGNTIILNIVDILKNSLNNNTNIYKVSGDKFYIITKDDNVRKKLEDIKNNIKNLKLKESYNFEEDIKIAFYEKKKLMSTNKIFEYLEVLSDITKDREISIVELDTSTKEMLKRRNEIKKKLISRKIEGIYAVYQPKFNIKTKKILGAEALARWEEKTLGIIYPNEFISIAEELNKVYLIDYKIAEETFKFIKKIPKEYNDFRISFNISLQTFEREDFLKVIENLIKKYKVDPKLLEIELTETILGLNLVTIIEKINYLKKIGISVSIDDFTAGNSSISLLSVLPVDIIKFDKSILDRIGTDNTVANKIYKGLIEIVNASDFKIVAEGIETEEQLEFLKINNVEVGQGYIFSKPISEKEFFKLSNWI